MIGAIALISCKKDRVCECTSTSTAPGTGSSVNTTTILDVSKGTAQANCMSTQSTYTVNGTSVTNTSTCKLK